MPFDALEVMVKLPVADPAVVGANFALNVVLWPAFKVSGTDNPLMLNPAPLADAAEIVTLFPPLLVKLPDRVLLPATCTVPKAMLVGFDVRDPWLKPVPESDTFRFGFEPFEVIVTDPLAAPAVEGLN